jgi:glycerol-3-phosphate dehydrogenase (NAD(P)+)
MKSTVLGTGAWGTTLAQVIVDAGNEVLMWGRNSDVVTEINSRHTNEISYQDQICLNRSLQLPILNVRFNSLTL